MGASTSKKAWRLKQLSCTFSWILLRSFCWKKRKPPVFVGDSGIFHNHSGIQEKCTYQRAFCSSVSRIWRRRYVCERRTISLCSFYNANRLQQSFLGTGPHPLQLRRWYFPCFTNYDYWLQALDFHIEEVIFQWFAYTVTYQCQLKHEIDFS